MHAPRRRSTSRCSAFRLHPQRVVCCLIIRLNCVIWCRVYCQHIHGAIAA